MYVVQSFNDKEITLKYRLLNDCQSYVKKYANKVITISYELFRDYMEPAYAITTYAVESQTISIPHSIWEFSRMTAKNRDTPP